VHTYKPIIALVGPSILDRLGREVLGFPQVERLPSVLAQTLAHDVENLFLALPTVIESGAHLLLRR